jgi:NitT/TauT family transport system permease protein
MIQPLRSTRRSVLAGGAVPRGRSAGLAYELLQSGFQLDIPRMFAALLPITVTGLALFGLMVGLQQRLLGHWHDSAVKVES